MTVPIVIECTEWYNHGHDDCKGDAPHVLIEVLLLMTAATVSWPHVPRREPFVAWRPRFVASPLSREQPSINSQIDTIPTSILTVFDLAFVVVCFTTVFSTFAALVAALRGRRDRAGRIVRQVATVIGAYALVLLAVSVASPQRFSSFNENQCSDDWCIAADTVLRETTGSAVTVSVRFRLSSRARRVSQRERFVVVYLRTADGRRIDPLPDRAAVPFDTLLQPGEAIQAWRRFTLPPPARGLSLVVAREGGFRFPGCCIVGDENSFLHTRTLIRLD